ncbi:MAG: hypothetical protein R3C19_13280 [Planctomycetaceae bacterium]
MSRPNSITVRTALLVQGIFSVAFSAAWLLLPDHRRQVLLADLQQKRATADVELVNVEPVRAMPLYDDATVVSDDELAAVLQKILPRFDRNKLRPNFVEHALRVWGDRIEFSDPALISGPQMRDYLLDSGQYVASWGADSQPILETTDDGVFVRWGVDSSTSVHHDHMLASLAEAGVSLETPVFTAGRRLTMKNVLSEALRDFRLDERETEWSAMAFGSYLIPQHTATWHNGQGREISFDLIARRLMRNHKRHGVCQGTHRVFSLMMLLRLDKEFGDEILSDEVETETMAFLTDVRDLIIAAQYPNGSWPPNWMDGDEAMSNEDPEEKIYRRVIATGHHLEWLAIAPRELHPPHDRIVAAADWIIANMQQTPQSEIAGNFTYYSHVGNALALWRKTSAPEFWELWRAGHPEAEDAAASAVEAPAATDH